MCVISQNATVIGQTADGHLQAVAERARPEFQNLSDEAKGTGVAAVIVGPSYDTSASLTPRHRV